MLRGRVGPRQGGEAGDLRHAQDVGQHAPRRHLAAKLSLGRGDQLLDALGHEGATAHGGLDPANRLKLGVGAMHGEPGNAKLLGQLAYRGQAGARRQSAAADALLQAAGELPVERLAAAAIKFKLHGGPPLRGIVPVHIITIRS